MINRIITIAFCLAGGLILYYKIKRKELVKWKAVGNLSEIVIYPIKAGSAIFIDKAECTEFGLKVITNDGNFPLRDRFFIIYEEDTLKRVSCKNSPIITKIQTQALSADTLVLSISGFEEFLLKVPKSSKNSSSKLNVVFIYDENKSETVDCGDEVAAWLSQVILKKGNGIRLGYYDHELIKRRLDCEGMVKNYKSLYPKIQSENLGAYSFLSSYLLINKSSLDDLNLRLPPIERNVKSTNFRSNLTISGPTMYEEDTWNYIKIGEDAVLKNIKPCTRCLVTTLNPETAEFNLNCEPLKTLRTYRLMDDPEKNKLESWSPVFGQYFGLHKAGKIKVGDIVYVKHKH